MIPLLLLSFLQEKPPVLEPYKPVRQVDAPLWLFAVPDRSGKVAFSAENTQNLLVARGTLDHPRIEWQVAANSRDTGGANIADHWHVFAHGHHWLSFSTSTASKSFLLKLDSNLKRVGFWKVAEQERVESKIVPPKDDPPPFPSPSEIGMPTNDHFLVAEPDGVAVGHFYPGYGHRIFRFDKNGKLRSKVDVGGGKFAHGNGSSALPYRNGYLILATETLNMVEQGGILFLETDAEWKPTSSKRVIDEDRKNVAMASGVVLESGYALLHARVCDKAYPRGERPPPPPKDQKGLAPDDGAIVRYVLSPDRKVVSREVLAERGNRPHTSVVGDLLITTWDGGGTKLRVDRIR